MDKQTRKYLLFLTKNYSYSILRPLYDAILQQDNAEVYWFSTKPERFDINREHWLEDNKAVIKYNPDAIFAPGNVVPSNWLGLKVQLFHGLGEEKQGHYRKNGLFQMYCTPGPFITKKFLNNSRYIVEETGWPKLDNISTMRQNEKTIFNNKYPTILYAPTFSKKLTSANSLLNKLTELKKRDYNWIIKFHELMDAEIAAKYKALQNDKFLVSDNTDILPLMSESDLMLTDTSSVAYEYLFFDKPIVTFNTKTRHDKGINILEADDLEGAIIRVLSDPAEFKENREFYIGELHPYRDGKSSQRVLEAVNRVLDNGYRPLNKYNPIYLLSKWKTRNLIGVE